MHALSHVVHNYNIRSDFTHCVRNSQLVHFIQLSVKEHQLPLTLRQKHTWEYTAE